MKDDSSLVVTFSSIPSFATHGPDTDLSSEGFEELLKDSDDKPTVKKRISNFDEEEGDKHKAEAIGTYSLIFVKFSLHPLSLASSSFSLLYVFA